MKNRPAHLLAMLLIALAAARAAAAQDDGGAIAALTKFGDVLESGDGKAIEKMICVKTLAQEKTRTALVQLIVAEKSLERAAQRRFGEDGKRFRCGFELIAPAADHKNSVSPKVVYEDGGRVARVERAGEVTPMFLERGPGGQWQVVLELIDEVDDTDRYDAPRPIPESWRARRDAMRVIMWTKLKAFADAFDEVRTRIENGDVTSPTAAQGELSAKLAAATADAIKARAIEKERRVPRPN